MIRFFCDCCGKEITKKELQYGIVFYNRTTKHQKMELHLCLDDVKKVRNMKFVPEKNCRKRKVPDFYNIMEMHLGLQKSLYQVPEWNLDQIRSINVKDPKKLFLSNGKRYYTKEYILSLVDPAINHKNADYRLMEFVQKLFNKQTDDEKSKYETKWHNNVGFNKPDAKFMSAMARISFEGKELSPSQLDVTRKRFYKYAEQVANLINEENEIEELLS